VWQVPVTELADIVVVSSYPADWDFWQAMKALYAAELVVKRGGDILLASPCPESYTLTEEHVETQARLRGLPAKLVLKEAMRLGITDGAGVNATTFMARIKELAFVQAFSPGITDYDMDILGLERATSIQDGLRRAFERQGAGARVTVITHGGDTLPVWQG
jgi:nickel-dependent lactate racemase